MKHKDRIILSLLNKYNKAGALKVIDIGAGSKLFGGKLPKNMEYITLDIYPKCEPDIIADINKKLPIKNKTYDFVICTEVLEHTFYPRKIIKEIKRITKDDGLIIISLPNEYNFYLRLKFLLGIQNNTEIPFREDLWKNHIQKARVSDIVKFYKESLKVKELVYSWDSFSDKMFTKSIDKFIRNFLMPFSKSLFSRSVIVVGGKK